MGAGVVEFFILKHNELVFLIKTPAVFECNTTQIPGVLKFVRHNVGADDNRTHDIMTL